MNFFSILAICLHPYLNCAEELKFEAAVPESTMNLGLLARSTLHQIPVWVTNDTKSELLLHSLTSACDCASICFADNSDLPAGERRLATLRVQTPYGNQEFATQLRLIDSTGSHFGITIRANIVPPVTVSLTEILVTENAERQVINAQVTSNSRFLDMRTLHPTVAGFALEKISVMSGNSRTQQIAIEVKPSREVGRYGFEKLTYSCKGKVVSVTSIPIIVEGRARISPKRLKFALDGETYLARAVVAGLAENRRAEFLSETGPVAVLCMNSGEEEAITARVRGLNSHSVLLQFVVAPDKQSWLQNSDRILVRCHSGETYSISVEEH